MSALNSADAYLTIPPAYGADLGGLWWSSNRDAIERRDGTTLALADEVRAVLEGALTRSPVPPFAFVLNLLHLMKVSATGFEPLHCAFASTRGTAARGRNVGLLAAELCRGLPADGYTISAADAALALRTLRLYGAHTRPEAVREPPLTRTEFERRIARRLSSLTDADLVHWFTHGSGPGLGGHALAEEIESLPSRMARLLALARRRSRLVGAASLVPALDAALTLPPRGRPPEALPLGGYADVTTRGAPERLLPGQFALEPDEFVRRFAENELLYFKREEPHEVVRPERIIVLDQGVRTWGDVRLALSAAAVSLLRADPKRSGPARLFFTSAPEPIDPATDEPAALANRLEASDLTPTPNEALERALRTPNPSHAPRDVILLTHARTALQAAAPTRENRLPNDRVFALAVDELGRAELSEFVQGWVAPRRSFRVDLEAAGAERPESEARKPAGPADPYAPWVGDVEPVSFQFRPGLLGEPQHLGFDADGEWLVLAGREGVLQGMPVNGTPPEVLPRPFRAGRVLKQVDAILGVTGGVVVCGKMFLPDGPTATVPAPQSVTLTSHDGPVVAASASAPPATEQLVAAHYDRAARRVTLHALGAPGTGVRWTTHPDLHCITVRPVRFGDHPSCALDLATFGRVPMPDATGAELVSRAQVAWSRGDKDGSPLELPIVLPSSDSVIPQAPFLLGGPQGVFVLRNGPVSWPFAPQRDGRPVLEHADVQRAQMAGNVLALAYASAGERRLLLVERPSGRVLGDLIHPTRGVFTLSPNGRRLARRGPSRTIVISDTADPAPTVALAASASLHDTIAIELCATPFRLTLTIGGYRHTFRVEHGGLVHQSRWELADRAERPAETVRHPPTDYDPARFPAHETARAAGWRAVLDRFGQVLLFRDNAEQPVAAFLVRRERAAAWAPGGFWGDPRLIGGPPAPDAAQKIARAIVSSSEF
jgi:hypothetical protein